MERLGHQAELALDVGRWVTLLGEPGKERFHVLDVALRLLDAAVGLGKLQFTLKAHEPVLQGELVPLVWRIGHGTLALARQSLHVRWPNVSFSCPPGALLPPGRFGSAGPAAPEPVHRRHRL